MGIGIYIMIYLVGCIICYLWLKYVSKSNNKIYTKKERAENLVLSIFSWIAISISILFELAFFIKSQFSDEEAKW